MLLGEAAHVWPYADADAGPIPAAACSHHQPVYPVAGSSSSHLLLQHPNVILDASHEPRLAIIGSTVSPPHSSMNARSDRLAIDGSSPSVTRHKLGMSMRKVFTALRRNFARLGLAWTFMDFAAVPAFPTFISPLLLTQQLGELPLRGKYECCWPFVGVCRMSGDQWVPPSLTLWCFPRRVSEAPPIPHFSS